MRPNPETYFATTFIAEHRALLQDEGNASLLCKLIFHYRDEGRYFLHAFVVMPDHLHVLITPSYDHTLERCMQCIQGGFAAAIGKEGLWESGIREHPVRDAEDYIRRRSYIAQNPESWGLRDYRYVHISGPQLDPMPKHLRG